MATWPQSIVTTLNPYIPKLLYFVTQPMPLVNELRETLAYPSSHVPYGLKYQKKNSALGNFSVIHNSDLLFYFFISKYHKSIGITFLHLIPSSFTGDQVEV